MELLIQKEIKMTTTNEKLRNVAEIAAKIMMGEKALHPNQQKLDVHEPEKDELTAKDFEMLRNKKKVKEETEEVAEETIEEATPAKNTDVADKSYLKDMGKKPTVASDLKNLGRFITGKKETKEEVDQAAEFVLEYESKDGKFVHRAKPGVYGGTKDEKHAVDTLKGPKMKELSDIEAEKKKKKKMSEMVATYQEQGLKGLFASLVKEEPDNEQFTKELEAQKAKNAGQGKKAEVAKAEVLAVQEEEFEVVMNEPNGYAEATIEERSMTEPEIKKKEEIVKSMKKGISGFKDRYGDRAKNVMYATATKRAMGEEVEQIEEGTPEGYQRRDGKLIPKIHPTMTPHEHGYDYTMQSIEDAPSKAKIHSQHKEIVKDNPHPQGSKEHKDWEAGTNKAKADHLKDFS